MVLHLDGFAAMPVHRRKSTTTACCRFTPSTELLKVLRSSA
ncbi:hypothetical protein PC116_g27678 [Phytophthora cactorum]|nr:hypothetical protein PC116_g27678 [Phytophthora cactorum]